jgi:hypothetical protein
MLLLCIRLLHAVSVFLVRLVGSLFWINIDDLTISLSFQSMPEVVYFAGPIEGAYNAYCPPIVTVPINNGKEFG